MGQEVKNLLRAQSKYSLMGSSAKTGNFFFEGHRSTFCIKMPFGIGHPPPTHQLQSKCVWEGSRVPNLQTEFNNLDLFKSYGIFSDFVVPVVSTLSPSSPRHPHIIPVSSPSFPHHPHSPQKVPRRSPWMWSPWSPWSPPHVVPMVPTSSPHCPRHSHSPQKIPMQSSWLWSLWSPPHVVPVVPVVPTSSLSSLHCPCHPHVISTSSRRSSHHPQPPRYPLHPPPTPGGKGPQISKNAIRFELIEIF